MKSLYIPLARISAYLLSGLLILGISTPAMSSLMNGGFETNGGHNSTSVANWTLSGNVQVFDDTFGCCAPYEGDYFINFNGFSAPVGGSISQNFATVSGLEYLLTFYFAKGGTTSGTAALNVDVTGTGILLDTSVSESSGGQPGAYTSYSFSFLADSNLTLLSFSDASTGGGISSFDALLDNVSVSPVPLPAAFWLFGSALIGFIGFSRRRCKSV